MDKNEEEKQLSEMTNEELQEELTKAKEANEKLDQEKVNAVK